MMERAISQSEPLYYTQTETRYTFLYFLHVDQITLNTSEVLWLFLEVYKVTGQLLDFLVLICSRCS